MELTSISSSTVLIDGRFVAATLNLADGRITSVEPLRTDPSSGQGTTDLAVPDGILVLPGNVDTHVHINEPGRTAWEGFASGTRAAALGGVTTLVDMPLNSVPPTVTTTGLAAKKAAAAGKLSVDTGFWGGIVPGNQDELRPLWDAGVYGFKCFLLPSGVEEFGHLDPEQFRSALHAVASFGGLVLVHAEDAETITAASGRPSGSYRDFVDSRPDAAEIKAIQQVVDGVRETGARTHLLHLSSARALDLIADARAEGLPLTVETCPHYLCFASEDIPDGAAEYKCCPPIRDGGNREALWQALSEGLIDCIVTDHSPSTAEEKFRGAPDLQQAWGGISGLQIGFTAVADEARRRGFGLERVSDWMAAAPAAFAGLTDKGSIAPGKDADFVFYDPRQDWDVDAETLAHRNPISAYSGRHLRGGVAATVLRANSVYGGSVLPSSPGRNEAAGIGSFLSRNITDIQGATQ